MKQGENSLQPKDKEEIRRALNKSPRGEDTMDTLLLFQVHWGEGEGEGVRKGKETGEKRGKGEEAKGGI